MKRIEFFAGPGGVCNGVLIDGERFDGVTGARLDVMPNTPATLVLEMHASSLDLETKFEGVTVIVAQRKRDATEGAA